jgi:hypothetical protein
LPTVTLANRIPAQPVDGFLIDVRDLSVEAPARSAAGRPRPAPLPELYRRHGARWKQAFIDWLGALNAANAGLTWWAYTSTAKNLLSSPLGNRLFQALAVLTFVEEAKFDHLHVVGLTRGQRLLIVRALGKSGRDIVIQDDVASEEFSALELVARLIYQVLRTAVALARWRPRFRVEPADAYAFTYVDANVADGNDAFFGSLPSLLAERFSGYRLGFLAYVQAPYRRVLPRLVRFERHHYWPLLFSLGFSDLVWGLRKSFSAVKPTAFDLDRRIDNIDARPLLLEALRWDLAKGGYLYNLLLHRAAFRFARRHAPRRFIYPYENKSLEKSLILGIREGQPGCRIVGYQHTSVTPRHTTLLFAEGEARATPLPDLIVTAGDVTRHFLETSGKYPRGIFTTGCALRQNWKPATSSTVPGSDRPRIMLALSSSRSELVRAVAFLKAVDALGVGFEIGVRPHPEFPLALLPEGLRSWLAARGKDFSATRLSDNLEWCTVTAYVSSTVALETMMLGKPVINVDLAEVVVPDPVLGQPPLWRRVASAGEFAQALLELQNTASDQLERDRTETLEFLRAYFRPITPEGLKAFLH